MSMPSLSADLTATVRVDADHLREQVWALEALMDEQVIPEHVYDALRDPDTDEVAFDLGALPNGIDFRARTDATGRTTVVLRPTLTLHSDA